MKKKILIFATLFSLFLFPQKVNAAEENIVNTKNHIYSYEEMKEDIFSLYIKYPERIEIINLGFTVDNRNVYQIILGNRDAKNAIMIQGGIHAREWMNSWMLMESLEMCLDNWNQLAPCGKTYEEVFENCCIYLIPMVNPDGVTISQFGIDALQSDIVKNNCHQMPGASNSKRWKANANGVDLNRQFLTGWGNRIDTFVPSSEMYNGLSAFTEPEAIMIRNALEQRPFIAVITYHSMEGAIYWDLGQTGLLRTQTEILANHCKNITGYKLGEASIVKGLDYNYMNFEKGIPTVCIETGTVECPLPYSQWNKVWRENGMLMPILAGCYQ